MFFVYYSFIPYNGVDPLKLMIGSAVSHFIHPTSVLLEVLSESFISRFKISKSVFVSIMKLAIPDLS